MKLNAPSSIVFLISLVIVVIALVAFFNVIVFIPISAFWLMTVAYILLSLACVLRGV